MNISVYVYICVYRKAPVLNASAWANRKCALFFLYPYVFFLLPPNSPPLPPAPDSSITQ